MEEMDSVEQCYSTNIKLQAFEDILIENMFLKQIFVTGLNQPPGGKRVLPLLRQALQVGICYKQLLSYLLSY